jgi:hypothetical protein
MSSSSTIAPGDLDRNVNAVADAVDSIVGACATESVSDATIQRLMTAAALLYAARVEAGGKLPATAPAALNATQGMIVTSALMRAVNVQVFELGLWQSWAQG